MHSVSNGARTASEPCGKNTIGIPLGLAHAVFLSVGIYICGNTPGRTRHFYFLRATSKNWNMCQSPEVLPSVQFNQSKLNQIISLARHISTERLPFQGLSNKI